MSINLRLSASANGTRNTFDRVWNLVDDFGANSSGTNANNTAAVDAFNTAYAAVSGRTKLIIPAQEFDFASGVTWGALGGDRLVISAYGATLHKQGGFANSGLSNDWTHHANIASASAGSSTVDLITDAETSRFSVNQWVLITEGDVQGYGYPINPWRFEYKKIQSIGTGTLTFTEPLTKSYSSAFPNYNPGDPEIYMGGPATVYALLPAWDQEVEMQGGYLTNTDNLFYGKVRIARYTDMTFQSYGPCPTVNVSCVLRGITTETTELEVDKLVDHLEIYDCDFHAIAFQSVAINRLTVDTATTASGQYWRGVAGGDSVIRNLTTPTFWFGVKGYGVVLGNTTLIDCDAAAVSYDTSYRFALADYGQPGDGALTISGGPERWAVPDGWCVLLDGSGNYSGISFQVTDIDASGGTTTISTTLSTPVPGTSGGFSAPWYIHPHPGKDTTLTGCTGNSTFTSMSAGPPNSPVFGWD